MIRIVLDQRLHEHTCAFVQKMAGMPRGFGESTSMAWLDDATDPPRMVGAAVFHNYQPEAGVIELSGAGLPGVPWMTPATFHVVFDYAFKTCDCQLVVSRNEPGARQLRIWKKLGASFYEIPHLRGRDRGEVITTLRDVDFYATRYGGYHGEAKGTRAA